MSTYIIDTDTEAIEVDTADMTQAQLLVLAREGDMDAVGELLGRRRAGEGDGDHE